MKITYTINDSFEYCSLRYNNHNYSYYDLLELLNERGKAYIKQIKSKYSSDLIKMEKVFDDFDKSNLNDEEVISYKYWRKQSKAKSWFSSQRAKRRKGKLKQYQIEMLNKIGMMWNPKEDEWEKNFIIYKGNLLSNTIIKMKNDEYGLSNTLLNNLKSQEIWIKNQRDDFKTNKIEKENLTRLNSINFPFKKLAEELTKPNIYSLITHIYIIKSLNEELKTSRKKFVNFYKLPQEFKISGTSIEIADFIVKKRRDEREKLELSRNKKWFEKHDKEQQDSHKITSEIITEFLNSKSKEYFINQIDRYGKQKPLTWNEEQNFKEAEKNLESLSSYQVDLYYSAYTRLNSFLTDSYSFKGQIKGIYYSAHINYEFCDEVKCYASEKMLNILNEKLLVTRKFNKTKSFKPILFLLNYYKNNKLLVRLSMLDEMIHNHQILSLLYSKRIEKTLKGIN
jgi:hypothetical protein